MSINGITRSWWYRGVAVMVASTMAFSATAAGIEPVASVLAKQGRKLFRQKAPHFSDRPGPIYKGPNPKRDELRSWWWTPRLLNELSKVQMQRAIDQAVEHNELFAGISPVPALSLMLQGSGDPGGGESGGGEGGGSGGGSGGGTGGGGGAGTGGSGGLGGETNSNTGNKLSTLPIVGWPARGKVGVSFNLYHNSRGTYNGAMGHGWSHSYDIKITQSTGVFRDRSHA